MIRRAEPADAAEIAAFWAPMVRETTITFSTEEKTAGEVARMIAERGAAFQVAERDGKAVGFATFGPFRSGPGYAASAELTVILSAAAQGQGLGRALIEALEEEARGAGIHVLVAGISAENAPAIAFHRALGFRETGRMPEVGRKFGRWLDLVLMQKILCGARRIGQ